MCPKALDARLSIRYTNLELTSEVRAGDVDFGIRANFLNHIRSGYQWRTNVSVKQWKGLSLCLQHEEKEEPSVF